MGQCLGVVVMILEEYRVICALVIFLTFWLIQRAAVRYGEKIVSSQAIALTKRLELSSFHVTEREGVPSIQILNHDSAELVSRGNTSLLLFAKFTEYQYISIICCLAAGTIGGIAAFAIASTSWNSSNQLVQGLFLGCAGTLSFWLTTSQVFKYQETIAKHDALYALCANTLGRIRNHNGLIVNLSTEDANVKTLEFLEDLTVRMESLRGIGISFDGSKIGFSRIENPTKP